ncbi:MAG: MerR family transcriptional regulator [Lachnospiraceae bacterium]|nr:MerR family transcriptional regulator [Lachnospiraceae bacterium]
MRTVKEVSELTGISVRTLHYYDEIGLLKPTKCSQAGYRLYDDKALELLQRILFFREFDMPLKEIKSIMDNPMLDKNQILKSQRKMLELKKERLQRLISSIDDILKGENKMDFAVFNHSELEEMCKEMLSNMPEEQRQIIAEQYGSVEEFQKHFMEQAAGERAQKNFQKMVEWYGDKESVLSAAKNPDNSKLMQSYQNRMDGIMKKLAGKLGMDVTAFEVRKIIGEYDFVSKQYYQVKDAKALVLELAAAYEKSDKMRKVLDEQYGNGMTDFFVRALREFYKE